MDVAILCLMLASVTTSMCNESNEEVMVKSLNKSEQDLKEFLLLLIKGWKETQLVNMLMTLNPEENSMFRESNAGRISLNLSSILLWI